MTNHALHFRKIFVENHFMMVHIDHNSDAISSFKFNSILIISVISDWFRFTYNYMRIVSNWTFIRRYSDPTISTSRISFGISKFHIFEPISILYHSNHETISGPIIYMKTEFKDSLMIWCELFWFKQKLFTFKGNGLSPKRIEFQPPDWFVTVKLFVMIVSWLFNRGFQWS